MDARGTANDRFSVAYLMLCFKVPVGASFEKYILCSWRFVNTVFNIYKYEQSSNDALSDSTVVDIDVDLTKTQSYTLAIQLWQNITHVCAMSYHNINAVSQRTATRLAIRHN